MKRLLSFCVLCIFLFSACGGAKKAEEQAKAKAQKEQEKKEQLDKDKKKFESENQKELR